LNDCHLETAIITFSSKINSFFFCSFNLAELSVMACIIVKITGLPLQGLLCCVEWYVTDGPCTNSPPNHDAMMSEERQLLSHGHVRADAAQTAGTPKHETAVEMAPMPIRMDDDRSSAPLLGSR
jgi:hypothetical protein